MATKRTSLQKRRGIDAIFESKAEVETESSSKAIEPVEPKQAQEPLEPNQTMIKLTVLVPQYIQWGLDEIQLNEGRRTGKKPEKYILAKEAFDLLFQQYGITGNQKKS